MRCCRRRVGGKWGSGIPIFRLQPTKNLGERHEHLSGVRGEAPAKKKRIGAF